MSHLPKMIRFEKNTKAICDDCGYVGTSTAMRLHMKAKHNQKGFQVCGVAIRGCDKKPIRYTFHKSGASGVKLV